MNMMWFAIVENLKRNVTCVVNTNISGSCVEGVIVLDTQEEHIFIDSSVVGAPETKNNYLLYKQIPLLLTFLINTTLSLYIKK